MSSNFKVHYENVIHTFNEQISDTRARSVELYNIQPLHNTIVPIVKVGNLGEDMRYNKKSMGTHLQHTLQQLVNMYNGDWIAFYQSTGSITSSNM